MRTLSITGASGFVGRHLIRSLLEKPEIEEIRILTRTDALKDITQTARIRIIHGDLLKRDSLFELVTSGSTVVNLAYLSTGSASDNLLAAENLAAACRRAPIERLIHCSTAIVVGSSPEPVISETTLCRPKNVYEKTKLAIEKIFCEQSENRFELTVLRPTAIFGPEGNNLLKLSDDLVGGSRWTNYLKSCLYGSRKMNLVVISNVVAAIVFFIESVSHSNSDVFIVSEDDDPLNNFRDVEHYLMKRLNNRNDLMPRIPIPKSALQLLLRVTGRSNNNPDRIYSSDKITSAGFKKPISFEQGLAIFSDWYEATFLNPDSARKNVC